MHSPRFSTSIPTAILVGILFLLLNTFAIAEEQSKAVIRVGIIGCDTSHVVGFTRDINAADATGYTAKVQVTVAYPGGSDDMPISHDRVEGFTEELRGMSIKIVPSIEELLEQVDAVMLHSIDGRVHVDQLRPVFAAKKNVFIDKPLASNLAEVVTINRLAKEAGVPWFSSSTLRYISAVKPIIHDKEVGDILGCFTYSPSKLEPHHSDLFWYGIHGVELLYTIMGPGCESVTRSYTEGADAVAGTWKDGRVATYYGIRKGKGNYGFTVFGSEGISSTQGIDLGDSMEVICKFLVTGEQPVSPEETIEIYTFLEAAAESGRSGGIPVKMSEVLERAKQASLR